jgi:hypothetical protein
MQETTGKRVWLAYVDRGYSGTEPTAEAEAHGVRLETVKHPGAQLRLGGALSAIDEGLRAVARCSSGATLRRFRLPLFPADDHCTRVELITRSS